MKPSLLPIAEQAIVNLRQRAAMEMRPIGGHIRIAPQHVGVRFRKARHVPPAPLKLNRSEIVRS